MTDASAAASHDAEASSAAEEWDALATALNRWGVFHVAPGQLGCNGLPTTAADLFERLARAAEPRLQQAFVVLLLTDPELAADALAAIGRLDGAARDRAMRRYAAAAALQRMARTRIALALGPQPSLPPAFLADLGLPPLDEGYGRETLLALADEEQARYGYDVWGTYRALLDLFLNEIRRRGWGVACVSIDSDCTTSFPSGPP